MPKYLVFMLVLLFLVSCNKKDDTLEIGQLKKPENDTSSAVTIKINHDEKSPINVKDVLEDLKIIKLSGEKLIAEIHKLEFHKDQIFVFDNVAQSILIFDIHGQMQGIISKSGKGPGEFVKIADFSINEEKDEIVILDQFNRKMLHFDFLGNFKYEIPFTTHARHFEISNGNYILYNDFNSRWGDINFNLFFSDSSGLVSNHMLPFNKSYEGTNRSKMNYLTKSQNEINYIGHYDYDWYKIFERSTKLAYKLDFGEHTAPSDIVHNQQNSFYGYVYNLSYFYDTEDYLVFSYFLNNQIFTKYYHKNSKVVLDALIDIPHVVYYSLAHPVKAVVDDYFVQAIDSESFASIAEKGKHLVLKNKSLKQISDEIFAIEADDNPVLILSKFKSELSNE